MGIDLKRGPDADKRPPTIEEFHAQHRDIVPTDFNEITVHPEELKRIRAERAAAEQAVVQAERDRIDREAVERARLDAEQAETERIKAAEIAEAERAEKEKIQISRDTEAAWENKQENAKEID